MNDIKNRKISKISLVCVALMATLLMIGLTACGGTAEKDGVPVDSIKSKAVTNFKITAHIEGNVTMKWDKMKGASSYEILRKGEKGKFTKVTDSKEEKFVDKTAKPRKDYTYKVVAVSKDGDDIYKSKPSGEEKVYVKPKDPKTVICGECYVEDFENYAKDILPKNTKYIYKIGIGTDRMLSDSCFNYQGNSVTLLERVAYENPDRVFFVIGMNETENKNPDHMVDNMNKAIKALQKMNPHIECIICSLAPVARDGMEGYGDNDEIVRYNAALKKYAQSKEDVYYLDFRSALEDENGKLKDEANPGDGAHWEVSAVKEVARIIADAVDQLNSK